jgi:transposase
MSAAMARQRREWLAFVTEFDERIKELDCWLTEQAQQDERVLRLQTHPGIGLRIGLLTSLALVHGLEPVSRFAGGRKVAAYVGLEPMEYSSGGKQKFGSGSQRRVTIIALSAGGGSTNGSEKRRAVKEILSAALQQARRTKSESRSRTKAVDSQLHLVARRNRLRGVPQSKCRSTVCPACNIGS